MINYLDKLTFAYNKGIVSQKEKIVLSYLWKFWKIEFPPYRYLSSIYNFFLLFSVLFFCVTLIIALPLIGYGVVESLERAINLYDLIEDKYFNMISFGTLIWLIASEITKNTNSWCDFSEKYWRIDSENCIDKKTNQIFIIFSLMVFLLGVIVFEAKFIAFVISTISMIIIYETMMKLKKFYTVKYWKSVPVNSIEFTMTSADSVADISHKIKLYSLSVKYSYKMSNRLYYSSQIYFDEPRDKILFQNDKEYAILRWIEDNKGKIDHLFVNPNNHQESVLFTDILGSSYFGKVFIVIGALLILIVVNNFIDLGYYFQ